MSARVWHGLTFAVTLFAVVLQLVLVIQGHQHLASETEPAVAAQGTPDLATRLVRFASYLTIWSNVLVAVVAATLMLDPQRDGRVWRALHLDAVVIVFGGGIVHFFFLRPLLDLDGADLLADKLLHVVVPLMAALGWAIFGPRDRTDRADLLAFLVVPVGWLVYTLVRGSFVDWYPYPFLDVDELGLGRVLLNAIGAALLMGALALLAAWLDRRLPHRGSVTR